MNSCSSKKFLRIVVLRIDVLRKVSVSDFYAVRVYSSNELRICKSIFPYKLSELARQVYANLVCEIIANSLLGMKNYAKSYRDYCSRQTAYNSDPIQIKVAKRSQKKSKSSQKAAKRQPKGSQKAAK